MDPLVLDGRTYEPIDLDLVITRGEDWEVNIAWKDDTGAPHPVAGLAMSLLMERSALGGVYPPDLVSNLEGGGMVLTEGNIQMKLSKEQTAALQFASTRCWLELISDTGSVGTWSVGRIRLRDPGDRFG